MIQQLLDYISIYPNKAETAGAVLRDFSSQAGLYFVRIRTPAAFLAGSSLGAFFTFSKFGHDNRTAIERLVVKSYLCFVLCSFLLSFATIVISTGASITVLYGDFDGNAKTPYALLIREFEYEFTITRWAYSMALLCFLVAVTHRAVLEFDLTKKHRKNQRMALICTMTALISHLFSYINQHLFSWRSLFHMTLYVMEMVVRKTVKEKDPLQTLSILATLLAAYYGFKVILSKEKLKEE